MPRPPTGNVALKQLLVELACNAGLDLPSDITIEGPLATRPYSRIYRVEVPNSSTALAAKICLHPGRLTPDSKFAGRQYNELVRSYESMNGISMFRVPKPVALFPEQAIILMEWAGGEPLVKILRQRWIPAKIVIEGVKLAGAWLRHFHEAGLVSSRMFNETELLERISQIRTDLSNQNVKSSTITDALLMLENLIPTLATCRIARSWLHGDFQPGNIVVAPTVVFGLDLAPSAKGPGLADAAHFLNYIGRLAFLPKGIHLLPARDRIMTAFIAAYLDQGRSKDYFALHWFLVLDDLQFLAHNYRRTKTPLHRWYFSTVEKITIAQSLKRLQSFGFHRSLRGGHT